MAKDKPVRTRFAPSPTGYMHVGGVRTALFAWLVAKQNGGQFILRIEDTDKAREVKGSEKHIMESLAWLGLEWDEGPDKGGPSGPYRQSDRLDIYKEWGQKLVAAGRAYGDPHSPAQLDRLRAAAIEQKRPFLFREHRPKKLPAWDGTTPLRFKSQPKDYSWRDAVMGSLKSGPKAVDDFIIIKSDGYPTYNFAHIIDDHLMGVSHVIRSQEFLPSVPRFLNLYEALGIKPPTLATLPYVMGPGGNKKLSKRDGAKDILDYKNSGYLPEALINFLVTLGWNDGTKQELFSRDELIKKFDLGRVQRDGARFDETRLVWMNGHYIRQLPLDELARRAESYWPPDAAKAEPGYKQAVVGLVQERLKFLSELPELTSFFFKEPAISDIRRLLKRPIDKQLKRLAPDQYTRLIITARKELAASSFSEADINQRLNGLLEKLDTKPGVLFALIRIAVTGAEASPQIFGTLAVLGKDKSLARIDKALAVLEK